MQPRPSSDRVNPKCHDNCKHSALIHAPLFCSPGHVHPARAHSLQPAVNDSIDEAPHPRRSSRNPRLGSGLRTSGASTTHRRNADGISIPEAQCQRQSRPWRNRGAEIGFWSAGRGPNASGQEVGDAKCPGPWDFSWDSAPAAQEASPPGPVEGGARRGAAQVRHVAHIVGALW